MAALSTACVGAELGDSFNSAVFVTSLQPSGAFLVEGQAAARIAELARERDFFDGRLSAAEGVISAQSHEISVLRTALVDSAGTPPAAAAAAALAPLAVTSSPITRSSCEGASRRVDFLEHLRKSASDNSAFRASVEAGNAEMKKCSDALAAILSECANVSAAARSNVAGTSGPSVKFVACAASGCGVPGDFYCSRCVLARYCSHACQKSSWREHRLVCRPTDPAAAASSEGGPQPGKVA